MVVILTSVSDLYIRLDIPVGEFYGSLLTGVEKESTLKQKTVKEKSCTTRDSNDLLELVTGLITKSRS